MSEMGFSRGPNVEPLVEQTGFRLSWGAIIAGLVVAVSIQIVLTLLGIAIGFDVWNPGDRVGGLGMALGIWTIVAGLIALFVGGMVTGRLAGILTRGDGALHGLVLWGISTLVAAWLVASGVSAIAGGALRLVGGTASAVASGVASVGSTAANQIGGVDTQSLRSEVEAALRETGDPALRPDTLAAEAERIGQRVTGPASVDAIVQDQMNTIQQKAGQIDRSDMVNVLTARTDLNRQEADRVASRIETVIQDVARQASTAADTAAQFAERAAGSATDAASTAAWWTLLALGLSLGAAVGGATLKARA